MFQFNSYFTSTPFSAQHNLLRRAGPNVLCAFLCNASGSEFVTIRIESDGNGFVMHRIDLIPAPEFDLIEFDINEQRIWGLWCNSQGEFNVSSFSLMPNNGSNWVTAGLEALPDRKMEDGTDPRQAYCSYIFYPGRFQRDVIDRALIVSILTSQFPFECTYYNSFSHTFV